MILLLSFLLFFFGTCYYNQKYQNAANNGKSDYSGDKNEWDMVIPLNKTFGDWGPLILTPDGELRLVTLQKNEGETLKYYLNIISPEGKWRKIDLPGFPLPDTILNSKEGDFFAAIGSPMTPYIYQGYDTKTGEKLWSFDKEVLHLDWADGLFSVNDDENILMAGYGNSAILFEAFEKTDELWEMRGSGARFVADYPCVSVVEEKVYVWYANSTIEYKGVFTIDVKTGNILQKTDDMSELVEIDFVSKPVISSNSSSMYNLVGSMGSLTTGSYLLKTDLKTGKNLWMMNITCDISTPTLAPSLSNDDSQIFIACGKYLASVSLDQQKKLWDLTLDDCEGTWPQVESSPIVTADDSLMAVVCTTQIYVVDTSTGKIAKKIKPIEDPGYQAFNVWITTDSSNNLYYCYGDAYGMFLSLPDFELGVKCSKIRMD